MSAPWSYRQWKTGGERTTFGDVTLDSTVHCGAGQNFQEIAPNHVRFRARAGLEPYSWRCHFRIESPGDGRELVLEVADFNHFGQALWQEQAAVISRDGESWEDLGVEDISILRWTPTGHAPDDESIDDGWHPPYGVRFRLRLDAPVLWFASPTPYTLRHNEEHVQALVERCSFFSAKEIGRTHYFDKHGFPLTMVRASKPGSADEKIRVVVVAGEHPAEAAGMYACEGLMEEILRASDLLSDFCFWIVPVVNVDGVVFGRTYHNLAPSDPLERGVNLARDWRSRTQPEVQAVWRAMEDIQPHCVVTLHNGRHRREFEVCAPHQTHLAVLMKHMREQLPLPIERWKPYPGAGSLAEEAVRSKLAEIAICFETLLLQKLPQCRTFKESYRRTGMCLLRGLVRALRQIRGKPQMLALREPLGTQPLRCRAQEFTAKLPWFYLEDSFQAAHDHSIHNFEVNGLPLVPGHYDVLLAIGTGIKELKIKRQGGEWQTERPSDGWVVLPSLPVPARKLSFDFEHKREGLPFDDVLITPEGMPTDEARNRAEPFARYVRDTRSGEKKHLVEWGPFRTMLMSDAFGASDLETMFGELVQWIAGRQVLATGDLHHGAIHSEEDKYDARDAAAAAACFMRLYRLTDKDEWHDRALAARRYVYRSQIHEPGNAACDGGFVHMVQGIWGVKFTRLRSPYPGIDGVDTCAIIHLLCRAAELGLLMEPEDRRVLAEAAAWVANNEPLPGMFLHHEGATHDCQNANALAISALVRATNTLAAVGEDPPEAWIEAAMRGIKHYLEGQETIGVWPYIFAQVGRRGQAFHFDNIPDHGIGLYHLTRAAHMFPLSEWSAVAEALKRAARWYLSVCRMDGDTIDLEYDQRPDLGSDICFSGFTWCRFTAAATLLRIPRLTGEAAPWRHLGLRLMEHVRRKRWQSSDPDRAPVIAHARPEAKLATWCQAAEWDAVMLSEMIEDLSPASA